MFPSETGGCCVSRSQTETSLWEDLDQRGVNFPNSDQLKSLAYHEIAHASHYSQVGSGYWVQLVIAELGASAVDVNQPHGNANSPGAGIMAICESWAEYIGGHHYVHRTYGGLQVLEKPGKNE